ncbi:hypothetical protein [Alteromonas sp. CYL-A6]|uniref:hypothetical protein n=1 Tax=Alteromonas nitratireducens TaxID=3390813 RepID=UPI0034C030CD
MTLINTAKGFALIDAMLACALMASAVAALVHLTATIEATTHRLEINSEEQDKRLQNQMADWQRDSLMMSRFHPTTDDTLPFGASPLAGQWDEVLICRDAD